MRFITELVHARPRAWCQDVDDLHAMLQTHGGDALNRAIRATLQLGITDVNYVRGCLQSQPTAHQQSLFMEASA